MRPTVALNPCCPHGHTWEGRQMGGEEEVGASVRTGLHTLLVCRAERVLVHGSSACWLALRGL